MAAIAAATGSSKIVMTIAKRTPTMGVLSTDAHHRGMCPCEPRGVLAPSPRAGNTYRRQPSYIARVSGLASVACALRAAASAVSLSLPPGAFSIAFTSASYRSLSFLALNTRAVSFRTPSTA